MYTIINFYDQYKFLFNSDTTSVYGEEIINVKTQLFFAKDNNIKLQNKEKIILNSDSNKYLIPLNLNFAHYVLDILAAVFFINYFDDNAEFIFYGNHEAYGHDITMWFDKTINKNMLDDKSMHSVKNVARSCFDFIEQLDLFKIKYCYINFNNKYLTANKIHIFENQEGGFYYQSKTEMSLHIFKHYVKKLKENNKLNKNNYSNRVYLSRSNKKSKLLNFKDTSSDAYACSTLIPRFNSTSNSRMLNEDILENFLVNDFNFKLINENSFITLSEQIDYLSNANILISQSGAAMANCVFMNEGSTVIELFGPVNIKDNVEAYHNIWLSVAQRFNHKFISIPHSKNGTDIVNEITNNKYLYNLLK